MQGQSHQQFRRRGLRVVHLVGLLPIESRVWQALTPVGADAMMPIR
jgi:hypothetical protein